MSQFKDLRQQEGENKAYGLIETAVGSVEERRRHLDALMRSAEQMAAKAEQHHFLVWHARSDDEEDRASFRKGFVQTIERERQGFYARPKEPPKSTWSPYS
jgi:hypothetical protein